MKRIDLAGLERRAPSPSHQEFLKVGLSKRLGEVLSTGVRRPGLGVENDGRNSVWRDDSGSLFVQRDSGLFVAHASVHLSVSPSKKLLSPGDWNPRILATSNRWLNRLEVQNGLLVASTDLDNTMWAGDLGDMFLKHAVSIEKISWKNVRPMAMLRKRPKESVFDYYMRLYAKNHLASYNFLAQTFSGLTLTEIKSIFDSMPKPKVYPEMAELIGAMRDRGVGVGFVSASPFLPVALMLEKLGLLDGKKNSSLAYLAGIGSYVKGRGVSGEVLLANLVQTEGIKTTAELIEKYGHLKFTAQVDSVINAHKGKALGGREIAERHALIEGCDFDDLRLVAVLGDNFGRFSGFPGSPIVDEANDQGMLNGIRLIRGSGCRVYLLNISRVVQGDQGLDKEKRRKSTDNFLRLVAQLNEQERGVFLALCQYGIDSGDSMGSFISDEVPLWYPA